MTTSTIYTITYRGTPAQLVGILWDSEKGDTGLAVIRLKGEGRYLRAVPTSELTPGRFAPRPSAETNGATNGGTDGSRR
jgi:hypothetical protein